LPSNKMKEKRFLPPIAGVQETRRVDVLARHKPIPAGHVSDR